jgi:hypothetical protein
MKIQLEYDYGDRRYHIVKINGWGGIEVAFTYLETLGITITNPIERAAFVRMLGGEYESNHLVWSDLENYILFFLRFAWRIIV